MLFLVSALSTVSALLTLHTARSQGAGSNQENGISIIQKPEPQSVCAGRPASLTWRYNASKRRFQNVYWHHTNAAGESEVICEYLLQRPEGSPQFLSLHHFKGRLQNITKPPMAVDNGELTLTVTETYLNDSGNFSITITDTGGVETTGNGPLTLTVMKAPSLMAGKNRLDLVRRPHNMTATLIHCSSIADPGIPPVRVSVTVSVPKGEVQTFEAPVVNGEGKVPFFGRKRFGTFTCGLAGPAADCTEATYQSQPQHFFSAPGRPRVLRVTPTSDSATVNFEAGFDGGTWVNFTGLYQEVNGSQEMLAPHSVAHLADKEEGLLEIPGLQPMTEYSVYVKASNSEGSKTSETFRFRTLEAGNASSIVGIVIGVVVAVAAVAIAVGLLVYKYRQGKGESTTEELEKMNKPAAV